MNINLDDTVIFSSDSFSSGSNEKFPSGVVLGINNDMISVLRNGEIFLIHHMDVLYVIPFDSKRHDGQPFASEMSPSMREWLCKGGIDPERVLNMGVKFVWLLHLWNVRTNQKGCV